MQNNQTSKNGLGKDTIKLTFSKVITLLIATITSMILVRVRTLDEYGTYSALLLVINLFTSLFMLGLPNSINYFLAKAETVEEKKHFLSIFYTLNTLLSIIIGVVLVLAIPLIETYFHNRFIRSFFYFLAFYPWASTTISSFDNVLVVYKKTTLLMIFKIMYGISMLLSVLIIHWLGFGFSIYMIVFISTNCVFSFSSYCISSKISGGIKPKVDFHFIKTIFWFSIPIGLSTLIATLSIEIDKLLIGRLMDASQLAIYTNAAKELPLTIIATSVTAVILPHIVIMVKNGRMKEAVDLWGNATVLAYIFISLMTAGVFVYAEDVMRLLYSEKYLPGIGVFRIYCLTMLVRCTYFGMLLNSTGNTKKIMYCSLANLTLNAILNPLFYLWIGMEGPALATLISITLVSLFMLFITSKVSKISFSRVFPWKKILGITIVSFTFGLLFWKIKEIVPLDSLLGSLVESILLGFVWTVFFVLVLWSQIKQSWKGINE